MSEHTPEPWYVRDEWDGEPRIAIGGPQPDHDFEIACLEGFPHPKANARRIVACVNACRGIETEKLEHKAEVSRALLEKSVFMVEALDDAFRERDEARAMVKELADKVQWLIEAIEEEGLGVSDDDNAVLTKARAYLVSLT